VLFVDVFFGDVFFGDVLETADADDFVPLGEFSPSLSPPFLHPLNVLN